jgi:hypothetical protein
MGSQTKTTNFVPGLGLEHALPLEALLNNHEEEIHFFEDFRSASGGSLPAPWGTQDDSSSGSPTLAYVNDANDGRFRLQFDSTNEVQKLTLYHADQRVFPITKVRRIQMGVKHGGTIPADLVAVFGLASDRNTTLDSVATNAWFRLQGSSTVVVEGDDGTTDTDDAATGKTWASGYKHLRIDIEKNASNVRVARFYIFNASTKVWEKAGADVNINAASGNVQPFVEVQKNSNSTFQTDVDYVFVACQRSGD